MPAATLGEIAPLKARTAAATKFCLPTSYNSSSSSLNEAESARPIEKFDLSSRRREDLPLVGPGLFLEIEVPGVLDKLRITLGGEGGLQ